MLLYYRFMDGRTSRKVLWVRVDSAGSTILLTYGRGNLHTWVVVRGAAIEGGGTYGSEDGDRWWYIRVIVCTSPGLIPVRFDFVFLSFLTWGRPAPLWRYSWLWMTLFMGIGGICIYMRMG